MTTEEAIREVVRAWGVSVDIKMDVIKCLLQGRSPVEMALLTQQMSLLLGQLETIKIEMREKN